MLDHLRGRPPSPSYRRVQVCHHVSQPNPDPNISQNRSLSSSRSGSVVSSTVALAGLVSYASANSMPTFACRSLFHNHVLTAIHRTFLAMAAHHQRVHRRIRAHPMGRSLRPIRYGRVARHTHEANANLVCKFIQHLSLSPDLYVLRFACGLSPHRLYSTHHRSTVPPGLHLVWMQALPAACPFATSGFATSVP
jgi:hypothetical protein